MTALTGTDGPGMKFPERSAHPHVMTGAQTGGMSRAFVKEDEGERWTAPAAPRAYRVVWTGYTGQPEVMKETDDLLEALRWMGSRDRREFEIRDLRGVLLATA